MPAFAPVNNARHLKILGALVLLAVAAGCAQPQQSSVNYDTSRENTRRDAESHALGSGPRAPSQIQLGFGTTGPADTQAPAAQESTEEGAVAPTPRPLAEARSFLGTVPCPAGMACEAARFTVTLAPSGEWRSRTTMLVGNQPTHNLAEQGCWDIIGTTPLRIALVHANQGGAKADLIFANDNMLRVYSLNGVQPTLEHRLTRQADIDPIDELKGRATLSCP